MQTERRSMDAKRTTFPKMKLHKAFATFLNLKGDELLWTSQECSAATDMMLGIGLENNIEPIRALTPRTLCTTKVPELEKMSNSSAPIDLRLWRLHDPFR